MSLSDLGHDVPLYGSQYDRGRNDGFVGWR